MTADPQPARRILLADADAFYVAVARLADPSGAGKAPFLIVGGSAAGRGVVMSASYEARKYGVRSAMPMARAIRLCPQATVVPVPWEACAEKGREIKRVLERFTPVVEQASSDECYLDFTGTETLYRHEPLAATAGRIRDAVLAATQLPVSIGGGTSKVVAKMAASRAKPRAGEPGLGVFVVEPGGEIAFMRGCSLADIPMIGPRAQERLARVGLRTVEDVLRHDHPHLVSFLGERQGSWLYHRVRGIDHADVEHRSESRSISRDDTFPGDLNDDDALARLLLERVDAASADLRENGLMARTVTVKLRDHDFTTRQASRTVRHPICSDQAVYRVARELLGKLRRARRVPARLIGVSLSQLVRVDQGPQLSFPELHEEDGVETERDRLLSRVIDRLRKRFGSKAVKRGSQWRGPG